VRIALCLESVVTLNTSAEWELRNRFASQMDVAMTRDMAHQGSAKAAFNGQSGCDNGVAAASMSPM